MTVRRAAVTAVMALGTGLAVPGAPAAPIGSAPATEMCRGMRATHVVDHGRISGTSGDDVIVVRGRARVVHAGGGDDRICVRRQPGGVFVDPGPGADRVWVETRATVTAFLDEGTDEYFGGPGNDRVYSGEDGRSNRDRVDLRGGDDMIRLSSGSHHAGAVIAGGGGRDLLGLDSWAEFEDYDLRSHDRISFIGSDASETVKLLALGSAAANLGEGDDVVEVDWGYGSSPAPTVDGGPGTDMLALGVGERSIVANVATHRIDSTVGTPAGLGIPGFEGLAILASQTPQERSTESQRTRVELVGDDGDNVLIAGACDVVIRGGAGDDRLSVGDSPYEETAIETTAARECAQTSQVFGEAGDDMMVSHGTTYTRRGTAETPIADLIDGGEGTDTARAGAGVDSCVAEVRVDCEV